MKIKFICFLTAMFLLLSGCDAPVHYSEITPKVIREFKLDNVPKTINDQSSDTIFLYENGNAEHFWYNDGEVSLETVATDVFQIGVEDNCFAILDKNNYFYFIGAEELAHKKIFADAVNERANVCKISQISSAHNFTAVLFDDGVVYSDIAFQHNTVRQDPDDFAVFDDYTIKQIFVSGFEMVAIDVSGDTYYGYWPLDKRNYYKQLGFEEGENCIFATPTGLWWCVLSNAGSVYEFSEFPSPEFVVNKRKKYDFKGITKITSYGEGIFAYNGSELYYSGDAIGMKSNPRHLCYETFDGCIYESNDIVHFWRDTGGIYIMLNDGTCKIVWWEDK